MDEYNAARYTAARYYTTYLKDLPGIVPPDEMPFSTHVYHQYTLKVLDNKREALKKFLEERGIPAMIYYPLPLHRQQAFQPISRVVGELPTAMQLSDSVLSLPVHTELTPSLQDMVIGRIQEFYKL